MTLFWQINTDVFFYWISTVCIVHDCYFYCYWLIIRSVLFSFDKQQLYIVYFCNLQWTAIFKIFLKILFWHIKHTRESYLRHLWNRISANLLGLKKKKHRKKLFDFIILDAIFWVIHHLSLFRFFSAFFKAACLTGWRITWG